MITKSMVFLDIFKSNIHFRMTRVILADVEVLKCFRDSDGMCSSDVVLQA